jgi:hypothetical protein
VRTGDGVADENDNCFQPNPDQKDTDNDGIGDVCDLTPGNTLAPAIPIDLIVENIQDAAPLDTVGDSIPDDSR